MSVTDGLGDIQIRKPVFQALRWEIELRLVFELARRVEQR